jgi:hypothetical protein
MTPDAFLFQVAGALIWPGLAGVGSVLGAIVIGTVVVQGRAVPAWLAAVFVALPLLLIEGVTALAASGAPTALAAHELRLTTMVGARVFAPLIVAPGVFVMSTLAAIAAFRGSKDRAWAAGGVMAGAGALLGIAPIVVGVQEDDLWLALVRGAAHFVACGLAAVALAGAGRDDGPRVGPASLAVVGVPLVVVCFELAARALPELILLFTLPGRQPANRAAYVERGWADVVAPWITPSWVELSVALVVAVAGVGWLARRQPSRAAALWLLPVVVAALVVGAPSAADFLALAAAMPSP